MQISMDAIEEQQNPYQMFLSSLKNYDVKRKYPKLLQRFLSLIPNEVYKNTLGHTPKCQEVGTLATAFVSLAKKDPSLATRIIIAYVKEDNKLVFEGKLSPNTVPNHIKPIKALLDAGGVAIHWKTIYKVYLPEKKSHDRAYERKEIQQMLDASIDVVDKVVVLVFSSSGIRVGAWDYLTWQDVIFFQNSDGTYRGAALLVYRGEPESYYTFITPEACKMIELYRQVWTSEMGKEPKPDDPLIKISKIHKVKRLGNRGVKRRVERLAKKIGLRLKFPDGKKRHEVALDHGFRKYFNTMLRRAKVNFLDKEDMMGHTVGLEKHYERYNEEDFERFAEYQKAIPFLTISDAERTKLENESLRKEKSEFEKRIPELVREAAERIKEDMINLGWNKIT
ncbi:MAG: site-specific integrase [Candidatus Nitrosotenuis sp.]